MPATLRISLSIILLAVVASLAPICAASDEKQSTSDKVKLKVFSLPPQTAGSISEISQYRITKRFQELYPYIELTSSTKLKIAGQKEETGVLMSIAGGTAPDILKLNFRMSDTYIGRGFLYPLDEYINQMPKEEFSRRVPSSIMPVLYREKTGDFQDRNKHYWMFPNRPPDARGLKYRREIFIASGLDPNHAPRDWNELMQYALKITNPDKGIYAFSAITAGDSASSLSYQMYPYISSTGATAVRQRPDGTWEAAFNTEEAVTAFEFIDRILKIEVTSQSGKKLPICFQGNASETSRKWNESKIAMSFAELRITSLGDSSAQSVSIAPIPKGPTGFSMSSFDCDMYGIFAGQKDKKVRDAAWEYIKFQDSEEARKIITDTVVEYGFHRSISPSWLRKYGYEEIAETCPPEAELAFEHSLQNGQPEPYGRNCQFIYPMMTFPIEKIKKEVSINLSMEERRARIKAILDETVAKANEKMLGKITPEVRAERNITAWIVVTLGGVLFVYLIYYIFTSINSKRPPVLTDSASTYKTRLAALIIAPAVILVLMWDYYPLVRGSAMSFQDYNIMGNSRWVGIDNFADILHDTEGFWYPLKNAFYFCILWLLLGFLPPLFLAVMLQEIPRGKIFYRILYYLPAVVSGVVILFMWAAIFDRSQEGILNKLLALIGIKPIEWLQESDGLFQVLFRMIGITLPNWVPGPSFAMFCVVFPSAWAHLGPGCIIYLAALKGIPDDLYEAADIDGASFWHKVRYIVIPYFKPLLVINLVGATIHGFKSGGAVLAMTGGGPLRTTHVIGYEIFERTFMYLNFGHGTAIAWVLGILLLSFTAYKMKILNQVEFRGTH